MPMVVTTTMQSTDQKTQKVLGTIVFSGNYPAGGEAFPTQAVGTDKAPLRVVINGINLVHGYVYNPATGKVMARLIATGAEHAAAAYAANITGDVINFEATYPKV